jgi:hypothetical protein
MEGDLLFAAPQDAGWCMLPDAEAPKLGCSDRQQSFSSFCFKGFDSHDHHSYGGCICLCASSDASSISWNHEGVICTIAVGFFRLRDCLGARTPSIAGRVQINYKASPRITGCNGGAYTALFDVQLFQTTSDISRNGSTWADIYKHVTTLGQFDSYNNDVMDMTGTVQLSGGCTGNYKVDPNSYGVYIEY